MAVQVSYPGVYIDEITPAAPIEGVGTSTAAFVGPSAQGEINEPVKVTSFDQFRQEFGEQPLPGFFLWYAVRGFFENGGRVCYVVRASNGSYASELLTNRIDGDPAQSGVPIARVRARQPGDLTGPNEIRITVTDSHLLGITTATELFRPSGTLAAEANPPSRDIELGAGQAEVFRPGDVVAIDPPAFEAEIIRVTGDVIRLDRAVDQDLAAGSEFRLASISPGATRIIRIAHGAPPGPIPPGVLVPGTMLTISQGGQNDSKIVESVQMEALPSGDTTYRVTFRTPLDISIDLDPGAANVPEVRSEEFDISVTQGGGTPVNHTGLSIDPIHPNYYLAVVNNTDPLVLLELEEPPPPAEPPSNLLSNVDDPGVALTGGTDEDLSNQLTLLNEHVTALDQLEEFDDVNLIACPDAVAAAGPSALPAVVLGATTVHQAMIAHCELLGDRFAVLDGRPGLDPFGLGPGANSIEAQRLALDSQRGYAALYWPWLRTPSAIPGPLALVPPSGHVCGIMARVDNIRGVHKAPANEFVNNALGVERIISDIDHGQLNLQNINVIRVFQTNGRPNVWGARTTSPLTSWQYVNIRRLLLFIEESIEEGIRWAVFEPNNLQLWQKLRRTITEFLTRLWRDGALFGETAEEAFFVKVDEEINPPSERALGRLYIEIGIRPSFPAEFIIVRIGFWQGGSQVIEA